MPVRPAPLELGTELELEPELGLGTELELGPELGLELGLEPGLDLGLEPKLVLEPDRLRSRQLEAPLPFSSCRSCCCYNRCGRPRWPE